MGNPLLTVLGTFRNGFGFYIVTTSSRNLCLILNFIVIASVLFGHELTSHKFVCGDCSGGNNTLYPFTLLLMVVLLSLVRFLYWTVIVVLVACTRTEWVRVPDV
jgi:hypothetical protein